MVILFCLTGKGQRFANCEICASLYVVLISHCLAKCGDAILMRTETKSDI